MRRLIEYIITRFNFVSNRLINVVSNRLHNVVIPAKAGIQVVVLCLCLLPVFCAAAEADNPLAPPLLRGNTDAWTTADTGFQIAYAVLHVMDWGQTLNISKSPDKWRETNPILGAHPKQSTVNYYFAGTLAAHTAIAYLLPKDWRRVWQMVWIGIEGGYVYKNFEIGVGVRF